MDLAALMQPWVEVVRDEVPGLEVFDAHTHIGQNDPDGMKQTPQELLDGLELAGARGAFVFPMHELSGYGAANDVVLAAAADSRGVLVPFCRVNPHEDAVKEAERSPARRRPRDQAPSSRGGLHPRSSGSGRADRARRRATAAGA